MSQDTEPESREPDPLDVLLEQERVQLMTAALVWLQKRQRKLKSKLLVYILRERYMNQRPAHEIAAACGISKVTLWRLTELAKTELKKSGMLPDGIFD